MQQLLSPLQFSERLYADLLSYMSNHLKGVNEELESCVSICVDTSLFTNIIKSDEHMLISYGKNATTLTPLQFSERLYADLLHYRSNHLKDVNQELESRVSICVD